MEGLGAEKILRAIGTSENINLQGTIASSFDYIAAKTWIKYKKPVVIVCKDAAEATKIEDNINFFSRGKAPGPIKIFAAPSSLPYTHLIPQADTWIERLSLLYTVENANAPLIIAPINALLRKVPPKEVFYDHLEYLAVGKSLNKEMFLSKLVSAGYNNSPIVEDEGELASRGYIIDLWSPSSDRPIRIELDGDSIASIRSFDPATQRTSFATNNVTIIPVRSVMLDQDTIKNGLARLKSLSEDAGISTVERRAFAASIKSEIYPAYTETLLPVFHPDQAYLWDYLGKDTIFFLANQPEIKEAYSNFWAEMQGAYNEATHIERAVTPDSLYMEYDKWVNECEKWKVITEEAITKLDPPVCHPCEGRDPGVPDDMDSCPRRNDINGTLIANISSAKAPEGKWVTGSAETSLNNFISKVESWKNAGFRIITVCHTPMQADRLIDLFRWQGIHADTTESPLEDITSPGIYITIGTLSEGFIWADEQLALLTEKEIFGKKRKRLPPSAGYPTGQFASYQELTEGDHLVHFQHGVGKYCGMKQMEFAGMKNDFIQIEYLGGDKLYVPAYRLNQIQKYVGAGAGSPFLDKMGGIRWEKAKLKANRAVRKMAAELLKLYATRKIKDGFAFSGRDHLMEEFEAAFPYDETVDQMQAIEDIFKDMQDSHPADRLICGDVGYGKTEVAIRAAFRAVMDGKQAAIVVPTTILAFQHFETFTERFKGTPVTIGLLNRFRSKKEQQKVTDELSNGKADIVVGTHRLLQPDITFKDLGLLIIDEEHRFGVKQKETIKKLKATVDVISMSATPIPRSLHISLVGARDISVINTPPADRLAIRTYVAEFDEGLIKGAVLKEARRGGQIFFLHNRVETIEAMRMRLARLLPEVKIGVAHGQLKEHQLEKVMVSFLHKEFDVLLTTTIIESGLDISSANTIIVNRADTFGLAQLYQIRGRVGRSNVQAFAYLLIPEDRELSAIASKRLSTLQRYTELGSGFQIAMHDLEIRGAGNILGAKQSGHISAVGFDLYTELLEKEIRRLKGEEEKVKIDTEIQIPVEAFLPSNYISDDGTRIVFYKRISFIDNTDDLDKMVTELKDRFGDLPQEAFNLVKIVEIKVEAASAGIDSIQAMKGNFIYRFAEVTPLAAGKLLDFARINQKRMTIRPDSTIAIMEKDAVDIFSVIRKHLSEFKKIV